MSGLPIEAEPCDQKQREILRAIAEREDGCIVSVGGMITDIQDQITDERNTLRTENERLQQERDKLRDALKPLLLGFADCVEDRSDSCVISYYHTLGDMRNAYAALHPTEPAPEAKDANP